MSTLSHFYVVPGEHQFSGALRIFKSENLRLNLIRLHTDLHVKFLQKVLFLHIFFSLLLQLNLWLTLSDCIAKNYLPFDVYNLKCNVKHFNKN